MRRCLVFMVCGCVILSGCMKKVEAQTIVTIESTVAVPESTVPMKLVNEVKALSEDLSGELDAPLDGGGVEMTTSVDYAHYDGIVAQMKLDIDNDMFPAEFIDTLDEDMGEMWLIGCTDEGYIGEKVVEIRDYWNAKHKPATSTTGTGTKKPAETKASAPAADNGTKAPTETVDNGIKAPTGSNSGGGSGSGNTQGSMTAEEQALLDALKSEVSQEIKNSTNEVQGTGLTDTDRNIGMN